MRKYDGNTGRSIHIPDEREPMVPEQTARPEEAEVNFEQYRKAKPQPNHFGGGLQNFLSGLFDRGFEVEDLLLFAVLFLMYQETKDKELLIIMGGMFLL